MADLLPIFTLILPCEHNKWGSFLRIFLKFGIHGGYDQPLDKFKNGHDKIQNGRLIAHFDVNFTLWTQ